jgi:hypothetical protein
LTHSARAADRKLLLAGVPVAPGGALVTLIVPPADSRRR